MGYNYEAEKVTTLFTDDGQRLFLKIRDNANELLETAGAFQAQKAWKGCAGSAWTMLASLDRLVELGEIERVNRKRTASQHMIYIRANKRP